MEMQLQELIDQIKQNGVEAAEAEAEAIIARAKAEAEKIVTDAKAEAESILQKAKADNDRLVKTGEDAIRQAGRNLLISFRESVARELEALVKENVSGVYASGDFAALLTKVMESWAEQRGAEGIEVLLNSEDLTRLEGTLLSAMKAKLLSGVTLKPDDHFDGGFRIVEKDGGAYYDYSAEAVVEMLSAYLTPKVTALLKGASQ